MSMEPNNEKATESYERCDCGEDCYLHDVPGAGVCWGQVKMVGEDEFDGDYLRIHACEGHADVYDGGEYKQPPKGSE